MLRYVYIFLSATLLAVLLIGSFWQKMVGVEIIHVLQLIYFWHFTDSLYTLQYSAYYYLSPLVINDIFFDETKQNIQMY